MSQGQEIVELILFSVSGKPCALPVAQLQEVLPYAALLKPPGMPFVIEGFLNIGGRMHPVMRLDRALSLAEFAIELYTPMLVLKGLGRPAAFLAESVERVVGVPRTEIHPIESRDSWNGCVLAAFQWNKNSVALLSSERLLLAEEHAALREFSAATEARIRSLRSTSVGSTVP